MDTTITSRSEPSSRAARMGRAAEKLVDNGHEVRSLVDDE